MSIAATLAATSREPTITMTWRTTSTHASDATITTPITLEGNSLDGTKKPHKKRKKKKTAAANGHAAAHGDNNTEVSPTPSEGSPSSPAEVCRVYAVCFHTTTAQPPSPHKADVPSAPATPPGRPPPHPTLPPSMDAVLRGFAEAPDADVEFGEAPPTVTAVGPVVHSALGSHKLKGEDKSKLAEANTWRPRTGGTK